MHDALDNIRQVKNNWSLCSRWELEQARKESCFNEFKKNIKCNEETYKLYKKGKTLTNTINVIDQIGINKSENALVSINAASTITVDLLGAIGGVVGYSLSNWRNSPNKTPKIAAFIGMSIFSLIGGIICSFVSSSVAKTSTRVARYQTRKNELQDIRNFVTYTDEQIKYAEEKLKTTDVKVKDVTEDMTVKESMNPLKVYKKSIETLRHLNKDYRKYVAWRENYVKDNAVRDAKIEQMELSTEQKKDAECDKNFVLDTIKKMEIGSNKYEINANVIVKILGAFLGMICIGGSFVACWGLGKISRGKTDKMSKIIDMISKISIPAGLTAMLLATGPLLKLSKESASLGRYKERELLLSDERNFYPRTDEDVLNMAKCFNSEVYDKKYFSQKIRNRFLFVFNLKDDYNEFLTYKKEQKLKELKIAEILKTVPISNEQIAEAQELQKQTFMSYEKIDDKSECLVDDTTAAVTSVSAFINLTVNCLSKLLSISLLEKEISKYTKDKKMPGFFESLKLSRNLSFKKMTLIFILPYVVANSVKILTSFAGGEIRKKACKIGIMTAMKDLDNPKKFMVN